MSNTKIYREQGGSVMRVGSSGSVVLEAGGQLKLGNTTLHFGTGLPTFSASPGAVYFRSDGSISGIYSNRSTGTAGSVWKSASYLS